MTTGLDSEIVVSFRNYNISSGPSGSRSSDLYSPLAFNGLQKGQELGLVEVLGHPHHGRRHFHSCMVRTLGMLALALLGFVIRSKVTMREGLLESTAPSSGCGD